MYYYIIHNTSSTPILRKQCDQMSNGTVPFPTVGAMMRVSQRGMCMWRNFFSQVRFQFALHRKIRFSLDRYL